MSHTRGNQDHAVNAVGKEFESPHRQDAAERKAHQVESFISQFVGQLPYKFCHFSAGKIVVEGLRASVPGQFKEVDVKPLRHELCQRSPIFQLRDRGGDHDERLAFARFKNVQARQGQVNEIGFAG